MCGKKQSMPPVIMTSLKDDGQAHQISVTRPVFEYLGKLLRHNIIPVIHQAQCHVWIR